MRELPGIEAIPAIAKPSKIALSLIFHLFLFCLEGYLSFFDNVYLLKKVILEKKLITYLNY